jgi:iron complex transport system substrate-binding protein
MNDRQIPPQGDMRQQITNTATPQATVSRRRFLVGASGLALGALAGCGGAPQTTNTTSETTAAAAATSAVPSAAATSTLPTSQETTQAEGATATSAAAAYPRTVTDSANIAVSIGAQPQRVVCLVNLMDLDALLSLGIAPVAFGIRTFISQYTGAPDVSWKWHEDALKQLNVTPERFNCYATNIEVVAASKPDLIVGLQYWLGEGRDELAELAPVLQLVPNWRDNLRVLGDAFAIPELAAKITEDTDRRIATALDDLDLGEKTVAIISCYDNTVFYGFGHPADGRADLFQRAGFTLFDAITAQATAEQPVPEFSIELLPSLAPADVVVLFDYGDGTQGSGILANPLFTTLPAVQAGRLVTLTQGELAQGLSTISPLNIDFCLDVVREAGRLAV